MAMDFLKIALAEVGILSERRLARLLDEKLNRGLPPFLIWDSPGLQSGFMGIQYTASSLVAENRVLATPASLQTVSTNAHNQDVVSMGTIAASQAYWILHNVERLLSIGLLCAAQALELRGIKKAGIGTRAAFQALRQVVPPLTHDIPLEEAIAQGVDLIRREVLITAVQSEVGDWE